MTSIQNVGPQLGKKKDFEYNEYEYSTGNGHPVVVEESGEPEERQQHEHQRHEHHEHHDHDHIHEHIHILKPISQKKPGYSAGSGLRSIAQGSADQASSAVSNQVGDSLRYIIFCVYKRKTSSEW